MRKLLADARRLFRLHPYFKYVALASLVLLVLVWALPLWKILPIIGNEPFLSLHYNVYFGVDYIGPWYHIFMLPVIGLVLFIINFIFEVVYFEREKILSYFFATSTVFVELILFVAMTLIVLLNI